MFPCARSLRYVVASACLLPALVQAQSASRGQQLLESRCFACHSLDANRVGPSLRGVVGRVVGKAPEYRYSEALAAASHRWDATSLKVWLTNPEQHISGQNMNYQLDQAQDREDVVAYLSTLSVTQGP
jgi:cytochrome c